MSEDTFTITEALEKIRALENELENKNQYLERLEKDSKRAFKRRDAMKKELNELKGTSKPSVLDQAKQELKRNQEERQGLKALQLTSEIEEAAAQAHFVRASDAAAIFKDRFVFDAETQQFVYPQGDDKLTVQEALAAFAEDEANHHLIRSNVNRSSLHMTPGQEGPSIRPKLTREARSKGFKKEKDYRAVNDLRRKKLGLTKGGG